MANITLLLPLNFLAIFRIVVLFFLDKFAGHKRERQMTDRTGLWGTLTLTQADCLESKSV